MLQIKGTNPFNVWYNDARPSTTLFSPKEGPNKRRTVTTLKKLFQKKPEVKKPFEASIKSGPSRQICREKFPQLNNDGTVTREIPKSQYETLKDMRAPIIEKIQEIQ